MIEDPIQFEVIKNALISSSREMSLALRRAAFSPNIKERRDCSCAIFDSEGRLVAQSKDIPVHLGAMPLSVRACIRQLGSEIAEGRMALLNDPYSGGSHLPDLTLVCPVYHESKRVAFVANRAHHADVGGVSPGSMPGLSLTIHEEGVVIPPRVVVDQWKLQPDKIEDLLTETRTPRERAGDLAAQIAANNVGRERLLSIIKEHTSTSLLKIFEELRYYSQTRMSNSIRRYLGESGSFTDYMESDGAGSFDIPISASLEFTDKGVCVSFDGTADEVSGNINCPVASTLSSVYYVFISIFGKDIPTNEGCWSVIDVEVPEGSLLNPTYPSPVSAGNVETSQRVVDVILGCLREIAPKLIPAHSQGTMNNLTIGGYDPRISRNFSFYETIGGGSGAGFNQKGTSGVHTHMTNTLNTPIESIEMEYPLRVRRYSLRRGSGGKGRWTGGEGLIREIELLADECTFSIQSERRTISPHGAMGGEKGKVGKNSMQYENTAYNLQSKTTIRALKGTVITIETPGGGGWGSLSDLK